jgi:hypothetical protein
MDAKIRQSTAHHLDSKRTGKLHALRAEGLPRFVYKVE